MEVGSTTTSKDSLDEKQQNSGSASTDAPVTAIEKDESQAENLGLEPADTQSVISRLRSRRPSSPSFSHHLANAKTSADALVDFDGPDDP